MSSNRPEIRNPVASLAHLNIIFTVGVSFCNIKRGDLIAGLKFNIFQSCNKFKTHLVLLRMISNIFL